jgi:hypothetical protein
MFFFRPTVRDMIVMLYDLAYRRLFGRFPWEPKPVVFKGMKYTPMSDEQSLGRLNRKDK